MTENEQLSFSLSDFQGGTTVAERLRGRVKLSVAGQQVWGAAAAGIEWAWDEFLENLAERWSDIFVEESYPAGLTPLLPSQLWQEVRKKIGPQEDSDFTPDMQDAVYEFDLSHNLSAMVSGIDLPSVRLVKLGQLMIVDASKPEFGKFNHVTAPIMDIKDSLTELGDALLAHIDDLNDDRSRYLLNKWAGRDDSSKVSLALIYGTSAERADYLEETVQLLSANDNSSSVDELRAAARMLTNSVDNDALQSILKLVSEIEFGNDPAPIDGVSENAIAALTSQLAKRPHEQGYYIARWLRSTAEIEESTKIANIEDDLAKYGVVVHTSDLGKYTNSIDAIALWRDSRPPVILLNSRGDHVVDLPARRATLAHELCHILLDRRGALPFLEVLGGSVAEFPERRANAFAAEFLCPQSYINTLCLSVDDPDSLVDELAHRFDVGRQLAANQVKNWLSKLRSDHPRYRDLGMPFTTRIKRIASGKGS